ncbi:Tex-like N-terminal domain-containing protein, partial [uncultured Muribaculum sp.]|uniref:Tex-like N-terminal domain-containing protein n=1 Tax=uncultured Muribaculum sp. TaxID=1918613 RepID=UPI0026ECB721
MTNDYSSIIAQELNIPRKSVAATIKLLDDGATIPFISRYRKEATGALDEVGVHNVQLRYEALKALTKRKETIIDTIKEQGKLTADLKRRIEETLDSATLEDLYMPFRPRRRTRAQMAAEKGLEPLARMIMAQNLDDAASAAKRFKNDDVPDVDSAIDGACDIIAEWMSESEKARSIVRSRYMRNAVISSKVVKGKEEEGRNYENYYDFSSPLRTCTSHRLLAILRGADEGFLKVTVTIDDDEMVDRLSRLFVKAGTSDKIASLMRLTVKDSYKRLIAPAIERELRNELTEKAEDGAIKVFGKNLEQLLMQPPIVGQVVLGWDPAFRTGCKLAVVDATGKVLDTVVIYPTAPQNKVAEAKAVLKKLISKYNITLISVGNGTASRESEMVIVDLLKELPVRVQYIIVNEAGASVYSASKLATEEFPNF